MRTGWYRESYRHALAARGIRTLLMGKPVRNYPPLHEASKITLYHGTHKKHVPRILKEGMKPVIPKWSANYVDAKPKISLTYSPYLASRYAGESEMMKLFPSQDLSTYTKGIEYPYEQIAEESRKWREYADKNNAVLKITVPIDMLDESGSKHILKNAKPDRQREHLYFAPSEVSVQNEILPDMIKEISDNERSKLVAKYDYDNQMRNLFAKERDTEESDEAIEEAMRTMFSAKKIPIPPAWTNVKHHKGKEYIVTGVDEKGRTQYIYPKSHSARKSEQKHSRIDRLSKRLPSIMESVKRDIDSGNNPEAEVVYMMYKTGFRPGTDKDTMADKKAYGASNLLRDQVHVNGNTVHFKFIGKKGVLIDKKVTDPRLAKIVKGRLGNKRLFDTSETRLRRYFNQKTGGAYQLKDLRTHRAYEVASKSTGNKKELIAQVAQELGNTPAVAKGSYINPGLIAEE